jgi:hypothetical protein
VALGKTYSGSVATFTGPDDQKKQLWTQRVTTDYYLLNSVGNDLRTIGLWQFDIPTLTQVSTTMTPQYFLAVAELLARPTDIQTRDFIGMTRPNGPMMALWGVRYVISDKPLHFGKERLEMPVKLSDPPVYGSPIRLYELNEPNLGDYSPTEVVAAPDAKSMLAHMREPSFDGRKVVITDARLEGRFVPAREASLIVEKGGLRLKASSPGESLLVLPVQYSHCWTRRRNDLEKLSFFRANLMQLGVRFKGDISVRLDHRFGPLWNSSCRREDGSDTERLRMSQARSVPSPLNPAFAK